MALGFAIPLFIALRLLLYQLRVRFVRLQRTSPTPARRLLLMLARRTGMWWIILIAVYGGVQLLTLSPRVETIFDRLVIIGSLVQGALWGTVTLRFVLRQYIERRLSDDPSGATTARFLGFVGRLAIWTVVALLVLENLEIEVRPLLAGLGVGGIAVALAVQTILGDIFASLSITLDKPFVVGDFIIVDDLLGTVEHVGVKTTRVKSLWGEQLVFSNNDLLQSRIRNYKQMQERRITFTFRIDLRTPREKLARVSGIVQDAIEKQPLTRFDRAHFFAFGESSFEFEVVYYMLDPDYNVYMDTQEAINLEMVGRFEEEGIALAYPTNLIFTSAQAAQPQAVATGSGGR